MNKKRLRQYRALIRERPKIEKQLKRLYEQLDNVPEVMGKVTKSSKDFPYIEEHVTVRMDEPEESTRIKERIRIQEAKLDFVKKDIVAIEQFIASIQDSTDRQIFEMYFIDGEKQADVADEVGYAQGRISQRIAKYLKD